VGNRFNELDVAASIEEIACFGEVGLGIVQIATIERYGAEKRMNLG